MTGIEGLLERRLRISTMQGGREILIPTARQEDDGQLDDGLSTFHHDSSFNRSPRPENAL